MISRLGIENKVMLLIFAFIVKKEKTALGETVLGKTGLSNRIEIKLERGTIKKKKYLLVQCLE